MIQQKKSKNMKARIVKVKSGKSEWYEVQVRLLGFLWIGADLYKSTFPQMFHSVSEAEDNLYKLAKPTYRKTVEKVVTL